MQRSPKAFYAGVFLLSLAMLASQFLLTRLLSIVFWYHFVFMMVSVVMFGLTAGTLIVYLFPKTFKLEKTMEHIARYAILSGVTICVTLLSLFYLPGIWASFGITLENIVKWYFPILILPFVFLGMSFAFILTRFTENIGKIYAVNLIGSAAGCLAAYFILNIFNGASAIFILSALCLLSAVFFSMSSVNLNKILINFLVIVSILLGFAALYNQKYDLIRMVWHKERYRTLSVYSKWNFFSYVTLGYPGFSPFGWGFSTKVQQEPIKTEELMFLIDEGAGTVLTKFEKIEDLNYLNMDISSLAHHIRPCRSCLVIGSGGGRDLLTAVINGAQKVVGVEINGDIMKKAYSYVLNSSGTILQQFPQIEVHNDDGRSFVARSPDRYDLIQASLVDSAAAASSGAFALSENSLYTVEAWETYLKHLTPAGVLTFSRWHHAEPLEIYRLLTLAKSALRKMGITNYREHILLAIAPREDASWHNVGTILVSPTPFTDEEIKKLQKVTDELEFKVALTKDSSINPVFEKIFEQPGDVYDFPSVIGNINPPTDNRPFFFYFSDFKHFFKDISDGSGPKILREVTLLIIIFGAIFLLVPILVTPQSKGLDKIQLLPTVYFSSIGLAFMFIEIPLIQRLGIFLGHPVYGLTVVLFGILLACGLGSNFSKKVRSPRQIKTAFMVLLGLIVLAAFLLPAVIQWATAAPVFSKIMIALVSLVGIGFLMGIPFPLGVSSISNRPKVPLIFYWAINGFTSMCGSAFATVILIHMGYPYAIMIGFFFYFIAFLSVQGMVSSKSR